LIHLYQQKSEYLNCIRLAFRLVFHRLELELELEYMEIALVNWWDVRELLQLTSAPSDGWPTNFQINPLSLSPVQSWQLMLCRSEETLLLPSREEEEFLPIDITSVAKIKIYMRRELKIYGETIFEHEKDRKYYLYVVNCCNHFPLQEFMEEADMVPSDTADKKNMESENTLQYQRPLSPSSAVFTTTALQYQRPSSPSSAVFMTVNFFFCHIEDVTNEVKKLESAWELRSMRFHHNLCDILNAVSHSHLMAR
ncbi:hypothetical protein L9F63_002732, partial [Diploptera punctata]